MSYEEYLNEYDRRVAESKSSRVFLPPAIAVLLAFAFIFYSQRSQRRRADAMMAEQRQWIGEAAAHNRRMIELLESIDRKLDARILGGSRRSNDAG